MSVAVYTFIQVSDPHTAISFIAFRAQSTRLTTHWLSSPSMVHNVPRVLASPNGEMKPRNPMRS